LNCEYELVIGRRMARDILSKATISYQAEQMVELLVSTVVAARGRTSGWPSLNPHLLTDFA
jgi:hypothetical protein